MKTNRRRVLALLGIASAGTVTYVLGDKTDLFESTSPFTSKSTTPIHPELEVPATLHSTRLASEQQDIDTIDSYTLSFSYKSIQLLDPGIAEFSRVRLKPHPSGEGDTVELAEGMVDIEEVFAALRALWRVPEEVTVTSRFSGQDVTLVGGRGRGDNWYLLGLGEWVSQQTSDTVSIPAFFAIRARTKERALAIAHQRPLT